VHRESSCDDEDDFFLWMTRCEMRDTKRWMPGDCGVVLHLLNCGLETQIEDRPSFHRFMQDGSRMSSLTLW
jgi:hypothetical protein